MAFSDLWRCRSATGFDVVVRIPVPAISAGNPDVVRLCAGDGGGGWWNGMRDGVGIDQIRVVLLETKVKVKGKGKR